MLLVAGAECNCARGKSVDGEDRGGGDGGKLAESDKTKLSVRPPLRRRLVPRSTCMTRPLSPVPLLCLGWREWPGLPEDDRAAPTTTPPASITTPSYNRAVLSGKG